jgi:hypothetical protein
MDIRALLLNSITYARETLAGKWSRWLIFIVFAIPASLIRFVFDPKKIMTGTRMDWSTIPWGQVVALIGIGLLLSFFITGYIVRIYRGTNTPPEFNGWGDLFITGIKLDIVWFLWILPLLIVLVAGIAIAFAGYLSAHGGSPSIALMALLPLILLAEIILVVIVALFGILGAIRFARTGSIREGIRFSEILTRIRTIGWLSYIIALIVFFVTALVWVVFVVLLSFIPYVGWVLVLIVNPVFMVYMARYFTLVYNMGEPEQVPPAPVV